MLIIEAVSDQLSAFSSQLSVGATSFQQSALSETQETKIRKLSVERFLLNADCRSLFAES